MSNEPVIQTAGLSKHYGDVQALVGLDLDIQAGEIFGFLGPNGAGKTLPSGHCLTKSGRHLERLLFSGWIRIRNPWRYAGTSVTCRVTWRCIPALPAGKY